MASTDSAIIVVNERPQNGWVQLACFTEATLIHIFEAFLSYYHAPAWVLGVLCVNGLCHLRVRIVCMVSSKPVCKLLL